MKLKLIPIVFLASMYLVNCTTISEISGTKPRTGFNFHNSVCVCTTMDWIYKNSDNQIVFTYLDYYLNWEEKHL